MGNPRSKNGHRRRELLKRVRQIGDACWICGMPIDPNLPAGHPLSIEVDELVPVSHGGSPIDFSNTAATHRCCNNWRGTKPVGLVDAMRSEIVRAFGVYGDPLDFVDKAKCLEASRTPTQYASISPTTNW